MPDCLKEPEMTLTIKSFLSDTETPVSLFDKLHAAFPLMFLFESADRDKQVARFSLIGIDPILSLRLKEGQAIIADYRDGSESIEAVTDPFKLLQQRQEEILPSLDPMPSSLADLPLTAGWVGYLGYGMTRYFENIPQPKLDVLHVPDAYMALYDSMIVFDHLYHRIHFISHRTEENAQILLDKVNHALSSPDPRHITQPLAFEDIPDETIFDGVEYAVTKETFLDAVKQCRQYIIDGQAFQIVTCQRFSLPVQCSALDIYRMVTAINPSPYAYYLKYPEFTYLGSSPETFLRCRDRQLTLKALAGTRPRGQSPEEDEQLAVELRANIKEMAEHRMLVDLGRNDLGRVCKPGTIKVGEIAQVIRYSHVMHLATEITGQLQDSKTGYDAVRSCFPRGTVSGAPKIRAMQLLAKLEPEQRGIYSGWVGYIDPYGNTDGAIAIRSALVRDGKAHVHAGAGVVYHSQPEGEYEETRNKARSMLKAIQMAERMASNACSPLSRHH
jgi:anthranilate synthase component I